MRVTKTIRNYIEETIRKKAQDYLTTSNAIQQAKADRKMLESRIDEILDEANAKLAQLVKETNLDTNCTYSRGLIVYCNSRYVGGLPSEKIASTIQQEIRDKTAKAIQEIELDMELGGTKAELIEALSKVTF